jgi:hypothetical protein
MHGAQINVRNRKAQDCEIRACFFRDCASRIGWEREGRGRIITWSRVFTTSIGTVTKCVKDAQIPPVAVIFACSSAWQSFHEV